MSITEETRAKMRAAKLGKPGPWAGKKRGPHSDEWNAKISGSLSGIVRSQETKDKIRAALSGRKRPPEVVAKVMATFATPESKAKRSAALRGTKRSPEAVAKTAASLRGRPAQYPMRRFYYGGEAFRSSWEVRAATAMDALGIKWQYEARRFDLGSQTYCPDFYLPSDGAYWEIKGYYGPKSQKTIALFREKYPEVPLVLATEPTLLSLERAAELSGAA